MMGYDYSGGGLGGPNRHMAEAIKRIRAGQTRKQLDAALLDKVAMVGTTAGIGTIGHALEGADSMERQANQRKAGVMRGAIESQTKMAAEDARTRQSAEKYAEAGSTYEPNPYGGAQVPDWLHREQGVEPEGPNPFLPEEAKAAVQRIDANSTAAGANIGGYHTPEGLDATNDESDVRANDIATGKNLIRSMSGTENMGGMMSSLPRAR